MRARLCLVIACLLAIGSATAADPPLPDGWTVYPTPARNACDWSRANMSKREWRVRLENGELVLEPTSVPMPPRQSTPKFDIRFVPPEYPRGPPCDDCILRVDDGWLVGYNFGEWGGRLWWTNPQGRNAHPVSYGGYCAGAPPLNQDDVPPMLRRKLGKPGSDVSNIVSLRRANGGVFVFSGLAHLGPSVGDLMRAERRNAKWQACYVADLTGAPETIESDAPDTWLVLVAGGIFPRERPGALIRIDSRGARTDLAAPSFMGGGLSPNSMVKLRDGTLYVGMRHFVARLIPNGQGGYRDELLIPAGHPAFDFEPEIDAPSDHGPSFPNCPRPH